MSILLGRSHHFIISKVNLACCSRLGSGNFISLFFVAFSGRNILFTRNVCSHIAALNDDDNVLSM